MLQGDLAISLTGLGFAVTMGVLTYIVRAGIWRSWMDPWHQDWRMERLLLLHVPLIGLTGVAFMLMAFPADVPALRLVGGILFVLLVPPWIYCVFLLFLPLPRWLYPKWAREIHDRQLFK